MSYIALGAAALAAPSAWFLLPHAARRLGERRLQGLCRARRAIVLTYDDGPGVNLTPRLLELLRERDVRATFFMVGRRIDGNPEMAQRVLRAGHEVGGHTQRHFNAWKAEPVRVSRDVRAGQRAIARLGGHARLFRPPFGKLTLAGLAEFAARSLSFGWWTVDSRDSWARRPIDDVIAEIEAKGGGVVLMHDYDMWPDQNGGRDHVDYILALTDRVIGLARENGYELTTLGELVGDAERASADAPVAAPRAS